MRFLHVHRIDQSNVGDVYCAPHRFFDFGNPDVVDVLELKGDLSSYDAVLLGGGGLGAGFFRKSLERLVSLTREASIPVFVWGAGIDVAKHRSGAIIDEGGRHDLFGDYFDAFALRGVRAYQDPMPQGYEWVPCVSCMYDALEKFRNQKPSKRLGYYLHKSIRGNVVIPTGASKETNRGNNIDAKLSFLADHEYIVTNTYHGTYWATLLGRKVVCVPFKSGLFSFKHKPAYATGWDITEDVLEKALSYPESLEECREISRRFHRKISSISL